MTVQCDQCQRAVPSGAATCEICGGPTTPLGAAPADTWTPPASLPDQLPDQLLEQPWGSVVTSSPASAHALPFGVAVRPVGGLAKAVAGLLGMAALVSVVGAVVGSQHSQLVSDLIAGTDVPFSEVESSDSTYAAVGGVQIAVLLATAVVYIVWFKRVNDNLRSLGAPLRYSSGWAVGAWFVPILNLIRPKQMHDDVWVAAGTLADPERREPAKPALINAWWAFFLLSGLASRLALTSGRGEDLEAIRTSAQVGVVADLLSVIAAVLAVFVVRGITARHDVGIAGFRPPPPVG